MTKRDFLIRLSIGEYDKPIIFTVVGVIVFFFIAFKVVV